MNGETLTQWLENNALAIKDREEALGALRSRRVELLGAAPGVVPMHEAARAAGITREHAWRLIREK